MPVNDEHSTGGNNPEADQLGEREPSKSARKREMHYLQDLGTALLDFPPDKIQALPLSEPLRDALAQARAAKKHGARKRLLQFIGKLMRAESEASVASIQKLLQQSDADKAAETQQLHRCEHWRDRILNEGPPAIDELMASYPDADRQWLRQTHRLHQQQLAKNQPPAAARKLFTYLRELLAR
ncbi:MAG: DUF615 domain-containing protein [Gammaproteobacteria bacterium]|nr:DUF615 domain-containing protein [Gammaproteobacteria bacterium]NND40389.1 DUF615 domain-containing protein [Pseudomonadales bacterium]MBT8149844.1 DUF615 domain-containing protein [Gammaproteobacteria bacterium]NNL11544.1 DUF615 domain-containing protein [Pseudomonadales bacterium]NNM12548.1 DUF615 domain-containing protein [Pseudomonadales bacterium]